MAYATAAWMSLIVLCFFGRLSLSIDIGFLPLEAKVGGMNEILETKNVIRRPPSDVEIPRISDVPSYPETLRQNPQMYQRFRPRPRPPKPPPITVREVLWLKTLTRIERTWLNLAKRFRKAWKRLSRAWVKLDGRLKVFREFLVYFIASMGIDRVVDEARKASTQELLNAKEAHRAAFCALSRRHGT